MINEMNPTVPMKKRRSVWKWVLFSALIGIAALVLYRGWASTQKRTGAPRNVRGEIPVQVSPAVRQNLTYSLRATGDISPLMQVDLFPKVSGYLEGMSVNIGDSVREGGVIAQIDRTEFLQKVREAEAKAAQAKANLAEIEAGTRTEETRQAEEAVKQAQSRFENARVHRERIEALLKKQIVSKKDFDNADTEYTVAEAQLEANQQRLKMLREGSRQEVRMASQAKLKEMEALLAQELIRLQNTQIVAPFKGEIVRRYVDAGALVSSSTPLVTLVHTEMLKVVANILEKDISLIKSGMKAKIQTEAYPERIFEGKIVRINTALELATRTLQAEIHVSNSDRLLKPGMFSKIEMALSEKPGALTVLREALIEERGKRSVFVVEGNQALQRPIVTGIEQDQWVEVLEGLKEGDRVIIKGQGSIKDRSTVRVIEGS
ncbi:MAG: efflux RND transporter periplasmic adaptor subunit [Thermodesulfobacteriota bacterium]|nr:efflux RND transporter periplasmic adaptor subunit [Thermodesulfobacteriota bacterium]